MKLRQLTTIALATLLSVTAHGVINFTTNTADLLEGDFQLDLTTEETNFGPVMVELNAIEFDGTGPLMQAIVQINFQPDLIPVEYFQTPSEDPALIASGSQSGTFTAVQTGGRPINYSYTNVLTDTLTISGNFSFAAVPEPAAVATGLGVIALGAAGLHRRRKAKASKFA
ncbi:hypothetical protein [Rubellicoccus peritrichatus]|uniref:Ice-binding protein C-terminal domain-containing protein n=1 Tax=Rubellicoccus peritrichatus TaxID=3080537 RepID=A0AAQ3LCK2_9BACT|nr:hypothetical protein [Puniceicoccus sp. CR14]WOO41083.1 hypothetical protein RZN69_20885 [Puniceicoccus sp. CR14]